MFVPIMWFTQVADLPQDLGNLAKLGLQLKDSLETVAMISFWVFIGVGAVFIIVGITFCIAHRKKNK